MQGRQNARFERNRVVVFEQTAWCAEWFAHDHSSSCLWGMQTLCRVLKFWNTQAKNLRSTVSRQAIICLGAMCEGLKRVMDAEAEKVRELTAHQCQPIDHFNVIEIAILKTTLPNSVLKQLHCHLQVTEILMARTGDASNAFIREDSMKSLERLVDNLSPSRTCTFIISSGAQWVYSLAFMSISLHKRSCSLEYFRLIVLSSSKYSSEHDSHGLCVEKDSFSAEIIPVRVLRVYALVILALKMKKANVRLLTSHRTMMSVLNGERIV